MALNDLLSEFYSNAVGVFKNLKAFNVQFYTEANVKTGTQFASAIRLTIPAAGSAAVLFRTTTKPVSIKAREVQFKGEEVELQTLKGATFTEGATIPVYGHNDRNQNASTVVLKSVTGVTGGTDAFVPRFFLGSGATNQTPTQPRPTASGLENILAENTDYVSVVTNLDGANAVEVEIYATWYEGELDYPVT